jgi:hypothetical protein
LETARIQISIQLPSAQFNQGSMQNLLQWLKELCDCREPHDINLWHKWYPGLPVRDINGKWLFFEVWRRRGPNGWEYQEREETEDEFYDRQW